MSQQQADPPASYPITEGGPPRPEEGIEADDLNTTMIVAIGLISTALLLASVLGVTWLVDTFQAGEVSHKVYDRGPSTTYGNPEGILTAQDQKLETTKVIDAQAGVYSIPIDVAKKMIVAELQAERQAANQSDDSPAEDQQ